MNPSVLTLAQLQALKADIALDGALSILSNTADNNFAIANAYNIPTTDFFVYRTNVPIVDISNQVTWANFTPLDVPDGTLLWQNRALMAQGKQFNLQILLSSPVGTLNAAKSKVRAGLQDALTGLLTGTGGASLSGGWVGVRDNALARFATRLEKLFADVSGGQTGATAALAGTMVIEGAITYPTITLARNS